MRRRFGLKPPEKGQSWVWAYNSKFELNAHVADWSKRKETAVCEICIQKTIGEQIGDVRLLFFVYKKQ